MEFHAFTNMTDKICSTCPMRQGHLTLSAANLRIKRTNQKNERGTNNSVCCSHCACAQQSTCGGMKQERAREANSCCQDLTSRLEHRCRCRRRQAQTRRFCTLAVLFAVIALIPARGAIYGVSSMGNVHIHKYENACSAGTPWENMRSGK